MSLQRAVRSAAHAFPFLLVFSSPSTAQLTAPTETGRVVADTFDTPALVGNLLGDPVRQSAWIYLPPDYDEESGRRYPVLYLLHGVLDDPTIWIEPVYQGMTIQATMDSLIGAGAVREMIVVMPNGKNTYGGSYYRNSATTGNWGDAIARDLVAHVDREYRTIPSAGNRAIAGHSMGGYGAIHLGMLHPDVFSVVYGINPCCLCCLDLDVPPDDIWRRLASFRSAGELWAALEQDDFWPIVIVAAAAAFSPAPDRAPLYVELPFTIENGRVVPTGADERWKESFPVANVAEHVEGLRSLRGFAFDSAYDDEFVHILPSTQALSDSLVAYEVPHRYEVYAGDHRNRMRERMATQILPWISERLAGGEAGGESPDAEDASGSAADRD
jgi:S-formylglutathione hydrolase